MNLSEFLLARIAEDEADYRGAMHMGCVEERGEPDDVIHSATCPNRVLAECESKRRIVEKAGEAFAQRDRYSDGQPGFGRIYEGRGALAEHMLKLLALPYADHPDYDPVWRP